MLCGPACWQRPVCTSFFPIVPHTRLLIFPLATTRLIYDSAAGKPTPFQLYGFETVKRAGEANLAINSHRASSPGRLGGFLKMISKTRPYSSQASNVCVLTSLTPPVYGGIHAAQNCTRSNTSSRPILPRRGTQTSPSRHFTRSLFLAGRPLVLVEPVYSILSINSASETKAVVLRSTSDRQNSRTVEKPRNISGRRIAECAIEHFLNRVKLNIAVTVAVTTRLHAQAESPSCRRSSLRNQHASGTQGATIFRNWEPSSVANVWFAEEKTNTALLLPPSAIFSEYA